MRNFIVNVNGTTYQVGVEEIDAATAAKNAAQAPKAAPAPAAAPVASAGAQTVESPMPGNIWKIQCKKGDSVKSGDVLLILEAMKMENEICAPRDGVVDEIFVNEGQAVDTGAALVALK
ncbi:MAG: biotin/lipoyl-containing protein [Clostridia bacterium]|nr:biotin/lipoyl-containing protein [Clostridia bacterium]